MDWNALIDRLGIPFAALLALLYTGAKGYWVFGRERDEVVALWKARYEEKAKEAAEWKAIALPAVNAAREATVLAADERRRRASDSPPGTGG